MPLTMTRPAPTRVEVEPRVRPSSAATLETTGSRHTQGAKFTRPQTAPQNRRPSTKRHPRDGYAMESVMEKAQPAVKEPAFPDHLREALRAVDPAHYRLVDADGLGLLNMRELFSALRAALVEPEEVTPAMVQPLFDAFDAVTLSENDPLRSLVLGREGIVGQAHLRHAINEFSADQDGFNLGINYMLNTRFFPVFDASKLYNVLLPIARCPDWFFVVGL